MPPTASTINTMTKRTAITAFMNIPPVVEFHGPGAKRNAKIRDGKASAFSEVRRTLQRTPLCGVQPPVHFASHNLDKLQISDEQRFHVRRRLLRIFAGVQRGIEGGWVGPRNSGDGRDSVALGVRHRLAKEEQRVAKERAESGDRLGHDR